MSQQNSETELPKDFHADIPEMLEKAGYSPDAARSLLALDSAFFKWKSMVVKGDFPTRLIKELEVDLDLTQLRYLTAIIRIQDGVGRPTGEPVTIGLVAEELNVDPSRASRLAGDLIRQGYLRREAAQDDGRKSILVLTEHAKDIFAQFRNLRWSRFLSIMDNWDEKEIATFSHLFSKFLEGINK